METSEVKKSHHGYNTKRLREILGIKQEDFAERIGMSQQTISRFENTETLDEETLRKIADALKVPVEAIKNFSDGQTNNFINTFYDNSGFNYQCTFNPLDKVIELYERIIQTEREKVALLEEVLKYKK
ncbi:MAG TPA: transcriptional regulator [Dysgonomonas sp.]|nr:transcriptional regulator [Dysgonomonas sp.]